MAESQKNYVDDNRFYILDRFDDDLRDGIVAPLTRKIKELSSQRDASIELWINSYGGDGYTAKHIIALVEYAKSKDIIVKTIIPAAAYSAASMLAITGTVGYRYIAPTAEHLIHYGQFDGSRKTTPLQLERMAEHQKRWCKSLLEHYKKYTKIPNLSNQMKDDDFYVTASQAIEWGVADKYIEELN